jgi:hypothetical protein
MRFVEGLVDKLRPWVYAFAVTPEQLPDLIWQIIKYGLIATALLTAIMVLRRLPLIKETMREFNLGRGRIWDLKNTVDDLQRLEPVMRSMTERFERLSEIVEIIRKQNIDAQLESSVERPGNGLGAAAEVQAPEPVPDQPGAADRERANRAELTRFYFRNARRLQAKVDNITDGRIRGVYDRIGWKRPRLMIEKMREGGLISAEDAKASTDQIEHFYAFRKKRSVPDEVIGAMEVLDRQLEQGLGPAPADEELG